jgi:hypothetical protein
MKFTEFPLSDEVRARLCLPDIPYEVPAIYAEIIGIDPNAPPLDAMLYALQVRAEKEAVDWLKLAPAMDRLVALLGERKWPSASLIETDTSFVRFGEVDLDGEVITVQRQERIVAAFQAIEGKQLVTQLFHPPCWRTISTILSLNMRPNEDGVIPYYGTNWDYAADSAAGNGQYYAAEAGRTYLAHWNSGVGIGFDGERLDLWMKARREAKSWPEHRAQSAIALVAHVHMQDIIDDLPEPDLGYEDIPPAYLLPIAPEPPTPLNAYNLAQPEGRFAFLWALYNDYQEDGLLMAASHVGNCLDTPRSLRCALMAQKVGKVGTGRKALVRFLKRFLDETLYEFEVPDLPDRQAYDSFEAWNDDCLAHFNDLEERMSKIIARYEAILDGREPKDVRLALKGSVIKGPWDRKFTN